VASPVFPRLTWRNLSVGIAALAGIIALAASVLLFAGVGRIRGAKTHLFIRTNQARGIMRGSEVWLSGQKIGLVDGVDFAPPSSDTAARVVIAVSIKESAAQSVRRNSSAEIRAGANIIGPIVVYLGAGTPDSPRAREGDTLHAAPQSDVEVATAKLSAATEQLGPIMTDARAIIGHVKHGDGTVGAILRSDPPQRSSELARLRANFSRTMGRSHDRAAALMARARVALAHADSVRQLIAAPDASLGRLRKDSTLGPTIARVRDELSALSDEIRTSDGTLARYRSDSAMVRAIADARQEMTLLFNDVKKHPLRYIAF